MSFVKNLEEIAKELNLSFTEESIELMYKILEEGMSPDNLVKFIREIEAEKFNGKR